MSTTEEKHRESVSLITPPVQRDTEWSICCSKSDSQAIKYFVQVGMAGVVMVFSMYCITSAAETEDKAIYWSLLSSTLTYFLDAPAIEHPNKQIL